VPPAKLADVLVSHRVGGRRIKEKIEAAFEDRGLLEAEEYRSAVFETVAALDRESCASHRSVMASGVRTRG